MKNLWRLTWWVARNKLIVATQVLWRVPQVTYSVKHELSRIELWAMNRIAEDRGITVQTIWGFRLTWAPWSQKSIKTSCLTFCSEQSSIDTYAAEVCNMLYQYEYQLTPRQSERLIWSRFVKHTWGSRTEHCSRLAPELLNRVRKESIRGLGPNKTKKVITRVYSEGTRNTIPNIGTVRQW